MILVVSGMGTMTMRCLYAEARKDGLKDKISLDILKDRNHDYWIHRAEGYSEVNREELAGVQKEKWSCYLNQKIKQKLRKSPEDIKILDIGAGPGFISIILAEIGYSVVAADFAETMIERAMKNAGDLRGKITFELQDAQQTDYKNETFDVVVSRNLTWNLQNPEKAYREWLRILKPGGLLLVFDANWYRYLTDEQKREEYERDRFNVQSAQVGDYNVGERFELMEKIAGELPLTAIERPMWDKAVLVGLGVKQIEIEQNVGEFLYSEKELINYASTPLFVISGIKEGGEPVWEN